MAKKKIFMSVTASAVIASSLIAADGADVDAKTTKEVEAPWTVSLKQDLKVSELKTSEALKERASNVTLTKESEEQAADTEQAERPDTYEVQSGDTISEIAYEFNISTEDLMEWNNLESTIIMPGHELVLHPDGSNQEQTETKEEEPTTIENDSTTQTPESEETIEVIDIEETVQEEVAAEPANTSAEQVEEDTADSSEAEEESTEPNGTETETTESGQQPEAEETEEVEPQSNVEETVEEPQQQSDTAETVEEEPQQQAEETVTEEPAQQTTEAEPEQAEEPAAPTPEPAPQQPTGDLIGTAKSVMGTPYVWGGQDRSGFDCSGFIHWAHKESGNDIGRNSTDGYFNRSYIVNNPQAGDLVFFEGTYRDGISHMGIYLGGGEFIHAGTSNGVQISAVHGSYWDKHFHSYKRFY